MSTPHILLRTGWAHKNVGDVAHTPGALRLLYERFPTARITVWSNGLNEAVESLLRRRFPRVHIVTGHLYDQDKPTPAPLSEAFDTATLFLVNSGMPINYGLFSYDWGGPIYNLTPFWRCQERGVPYGIFGQSFDKFADPSGYLFRPALNDAAFLFTRETESARFLQEFGIDRALVEFGPDAAFGIDTRDDDRARGWLEAHGLVPGEFLIVNIRTNTAVSKDTDTPLNPVKPTPEQQAENDRWMHACASLITRWVRETGRHVLVAPEAEKEIAAAQMMLLPLLPDDVRSRVVVRDTWWNADEAFSTFAMARAAFGMEPHTLIMALCGGVPMVHARPLRHGRKGWMFRDIGLGDWLFDIDQTAPDVLSDTLLAIDSDHTAACHRVAGAMRIVAERQTRMLDVVGSTLAGR